MSLEWNIFVFPKIIRIKNFKLIRTIFVKECNRNSHWFKIIFRYICYFTYFNSIVVIVRKKLFLIVAFIEN